MAVGYVVTGTAKSQYPEISVNYFTQGGNKQGASTVIDTSNTKNKKIVTTGWMCYESSSSKPVVTITGSNDTTTWNSLGSLTANTGTSTWSTGGYVSNTVNSTSYRYIKLQTSQKSGGDGTILTCVITML